MSENKSMAGHLLALITILIWGTTFISTKVLLKHFAPIEILFFRFVIGFLALLFLYPHRLKLTELKQEWIFASAGLCGVTLYYLLENIALTYSRASNVGVIISVAPFFTAFFAHCFLDGEKLKPNFLVHKSSYNNSNPHAYMFSTTESVYQGGSFRAAMQTVCKKHNVKTAGGKIYRFRAHDYILLT